MLDLASNLETSLSTWPLAAALWAEIAGSFILVGFVAAALVQLVRWQSPYNVELSRLTIANGVIVALSFKMAAALLKTVALHSWEQIGLFAATVALRTFLKRYFKWEEMRLKSRIEAQGERCKQ